MSARKLRHSTEKKAVLAKRLRKTFEEDYSDDQADDEQSHDYDTPPQKGKNKRLRTEQNNSRIRKQSLDEIGADNQQPTPEFKRIPQKQETEQESDQSGAIVQNTGLNATTEVTSSISSSQTKTSLIQENIPEQKIIDEQPMEQQPEIKEEKPVTETQYLNKETLQQFDKISQCQKLNYNYFISQMQLEEEEQNMTQNSQSLTFADIFKKRPQLNIELLQTRGTPHIQRNKLSDKFNRRDVQFYDLYIKKEDPQQLGKLRDAQFPLDIDADQYYNDLEVEDFNHLFGNDKLIEERFGKSIMVEMKVENTTKKISRQVKEYPHLVKITDKRQMSPLKSPSKKQEHNDDPELISLDAQLKQFSREYQKTNEEIAEIFTKVSGRLNKMKDYLEGRPVVEWNFLEDLALTKPDDSPEFQVLLQTKGIEEIRIRREFLQATPTISDEDPQPIKDSLEQ